MGAKSWATPAQTAYLHTLMPDYVCRQAQGKLHIFWPTMTEGFFSQWSEHAGLGLPLPNDPNARQLSDEELVILGVAIKARIKQLEAWFRYQRKKIRNTENASHGAGAAAALRAMFGVQLQKRKRAHKPIEIFQIRNPELVKTALTDAGYDNITSVDDDPDDFTDEADGTPAAAKKSLKSVRMRMRTRVVAGLYTEASDEEVKACEDTVAEEKEKLREEEEKNESQERSPSEFQDAIDALEVIYRDIHQATFNATGWVGMTILGGPTPRMDGELGLKIICFGQTPAGNDFEETCVDFEENVVEAFEGFVCLCYTAAQCKERALPKVATTTATTTEAQQRVACRIPPPTVPPAKATAAASTPSAASTNPAAVSPASTDSASPAFNAQDDQDFDISKDGGTADEELMSASEANMDIFRFEPSVPSTPSPFDWSSAGDNYFGEDDTSMDINADFAHIDTGSAPPSAVSRWPPGMTAPLSPQAAEALATVERGGLPSVATMAIDPNLDRLPTSPSSTSGLEIAQHPVPRPAYRGTAAAAAAAETVEISTVNIGGFNFPVNRAQPSSYPVSGLFNYFRAPGQRAAPSGALASQWGVAPNAISSSLSSPATVSSPALSPPFSSPPSSSPPTALVLTPSSQPSASAPVGTSAPSPKKGAYIDWRNKHLAGTATSNQTTVPSTSRDATSTGGPTKAARFLASLLANSDSLANTTGSTGAPSIAPALPTATPPGPTAAVAAEVLVPDIPLTRPPTRTSAPVKKAAGPVKKAPAAAKPAATANADQREAAAKVAQKVVAVVDAAKRGRGRPRKQPVAAAALAATTNLPADEQEEVPVARRIRAPVDHAVINFRRRSKEAGEKEKAAEKAAEEKEAADKRALEAKRGWHERVVDGVQTVTLTTCARKPAKHPDGTEITTKPKKTTVPVGTVTSSKSRSWADASTTRAAAAVSVQLGTKRKAANALTKDGKKKKAKN
ncbi:hypothetical protein B0H16DRAFT_1727276 [Mycena metata]|uniref:Uncharacterized protein n=1 Tax=Mycena metata TaxID=1033252 RepID=A0AAD7N3T4_9AGAR|nr:hypothetical protein B0H16DRAFT_1727276 [Mycena metata]